MDKEKKKALMEKLQAAVDEGKRRNEEYLRTGNISVLADEGNVDPRIIVGTSPSKEKCLNMCRIIGRSTSKQWSSGFELGGEGFIVTIHNVVNEKRPPKNLINKFSKIFEELESVVYIDQRMVIGKSSSKEKCAEMLHIISESVPSEWIAAMDVYGENRYVVFIHHKKYERRNPPPKIIEKFSEIFEKMQ